MNTTKFQIILITLFIIFIVGGVIAFAMYKGPEAENQLPKITIWGTVPKETFSKFMSVVNANRTSNLIQPNYVEKAEDSFDKDFIEALASDAGPDAVLLPHTSLLRHLDKISPISYDTLPLRDYRNSFVEEAEMYLMPEGAVSIPWSIDPLVMYWNRDTFTNAGIATPPSTWEELAGYIPKFTQRDAKGNIQKSAFALGEYRNIDHATAILSTLFFQAGNPVVTRKQSGLGSAFGNPGEIGFEDAVSALNFYTTFSNPADRANYTWNRSLPNSKTFFIAGKLAVYFGFASEIFDIRDKNPNLNFDVAPMLKTKNGGQRATFGNLYGFSVVRKSSSPVDTYKVIKEITSPQYLEEFSVGAYLPSVRRDVIAKGSKDQYISIFNDAALISKGWLTPSVTATEDIFKNMIENITSGRDSVSDSLNEASSKLDVLLLNY